MIKVVPGIVVPVARVFSSLLKVGNFGIQGFYKHTRLAIMAILASEALQQENK